MLRTALTPYYAAPRARGFSTNGLTKPLTLKQKARAFLRWKKMKLPNN
jgi:hypothetical protein